MSDYFAKMKTLADEMAFAGKKLEDEEIASYILAGLDVKFNPVVSAMEARVEPITLIELFTQLVSFEQRMDLLVGNNSNSSANLASRGRGGGNWCGRGRDSGRGRGGRTGGRQGGGRGGHNGDRPTCQLCGKEGHTVLRCYKRFDASFTGVPDNKYASSATTNYDVDSNWYMCRGQPRGPPKKPGESCLKPAKKQNKTHL
jgi:hypothetical protein